MSIKRVSLPPLLGWSAGWRVVVALMVLVPLWAAVIWAVGIGGAP